MSSGFWSSLQFFNILTHRPITHCMKMSVSNLPSPPKLPTRHPAAAGPSSSSNPAPLNPTATPFSPPLSSGATGEELPKWILLSPSSSEGRSPAAGRRSLASPPSSYTDAVRGRGKALLQEGSLALAHDGLRGAFMADSRRSGCSSRAQAPRSSSPQQAPESKGWTLVARRKQGHGASSSPLPPPTPLLPNPIGPCGHMFQLSPTGAHRHGLSQCFVMPPMPSHARTRQTQLLWQLRHQGDVAFRPRWWSSIIGSVTLCWPLGISRAPPR
jgi:hypothetical protein